MLEPWSTEQAHHLTAAPGISVGSSGGMNFAAKMTMGPSLNSPLDSTFTADLSSLAGQTLTLYLDVTSQDDGFQSVFQFTNAATDPMSASNPIPEPSSLVLAVIGGMTGLLCFRKR
jgi:PEP-CTERM motif-containing protein